MSGKELSTLQVGAEAKTAGEGTIPTAIDQSGMPRIPEELSILPVRGLVIFPGTIIPLNIQRAASIKLLDDTLPRTKVIGLLAQRDEAKEDPEPQDLYGVGTAALVMKLLRQTDDHVLVIAQGLRRFSLRDDEHMVVCLPQKLHYQRSCSDAVQILRLRIFLCFIALR